MSNKKINKSRKKYFREYARKNKAKQKARVVMGGAIKLSESIAHNQVKLNIKLDQIKKFLNIT